MKDCSRDQDCICRQARRPRARRWNCELKPQQPACACSAGGPGALNRMPDRRPSFRFRFRIGVRALATLVLSSSPLLSSPKGKQSAGSAFHLCISLPRASAWLWLGCLAFQAHKEHIMLLSCRRTRLHCIDVNDDGSDQIRSDQIMHACIIQRKEESHSHLNKNYLIISLCLV